MTVDFQTEIYTTTCSYWSMSLYSLSYCDIWHDDVIKWKHFPRYWPFVRGIHRSLVNSPHKGQWRRVLMFYLIWTNDWVNNRDAGDLRRHCTHYNVTVMIKCHSREFCIWKLRLQNCQSSWFWNVTRIHTQCIETLFSRGNNAHPHAMF